MSASESTREKAIGAGEEPRDSLPEKAGDRKIVHIERIEWIVAILLSVVVLGLIIVRTAHAGPLWRDECDSLQLARMPQFADLLENLQHTAFPILFPAIVRAYTALFGTTDIALRCFGLAVGILFLGAAWFQSRSLNREPPLLLPALIGLNVNFLTSGLWLRGYGLGSVLIVLAFALTAMFLLRPNAARLTAVLLAYLSSMHCLFFNGALVPAIVLAAATVLLIRREWKWMGMLLGVATVCGLSYLPYLWKVYSATSTWAVVLQGSVSLRLMARQFRAACSGPPIVSMLWLSLVFLCIIAGTWRLKVVWNTNRTRERDMLLFGLLAIPVCIVAYFSFLQVVQYVPLQRYYLALLCLIAAATTLIVANFSSYYWLRLGRITLVILAMLTLPFVVWQDINKRQSNIDTIAQRVETAARPNDLIVINHWPFGIAFNHYYHGMNRWITVPEVNEHRVHRYDLLQKKMTEFFPLDDVKRNIATTLKSGSRAWVVGNVKFNSPPIVLAPAPDPKFGWRNSIYIEAWSRELGAFLRLHASRIDLIVGKRKSVSDQENMYLLACEGWRY